MHRRDPQGAKPGALAPKQMPTNRQPVYHETNSSVRVISKPNGLWVIQKLDLKDGPWVSIRRPTSYETAIAQMNAVASN